MKTRNEPTGAPAPHSTAAFVALLDRCRAQVESDPSGYLNNPHLYGAALHHVYLRLCHGNVPAAVKRRGLTA